MCVQFVQSYYYYSCIELSTGVVKYSLYSGHSGHIDSDKKKKKVHRIYTILIRYIRTT